MLINLASNEYSKVLDLKAIGKQYPIITISFKEETAPDVFKVVGMYAKRARGQMVRYMAQNNVLEHEQLKAYQVDGYKWHEALSSANHYVFTRKGASV